MMKSLKDMSGAERYAWATLIVTGVVFMQFYDWMMDGFSIIQHSAGDLLGLYLQVIITFIILHIVVAIIFVAARRKNEEDGEPIEKDERDIAIERKGDRYGLWALAAIVEVVIFMMLFESMYPGDYTPLLSVLSPPGMFFALMGAVLVADIIKRATMIVSYRS